MEIIAVESQAYQELIDRKSLLISARCGKLHISGMKADEIVGRLNRFKDNLIVCSCTHPNNRSL